MDPDPDPATQINTDPDPKPWSKDLKLTGYPAVLVVCP